MDVRSEVCVCGVESKVVSVRVREMKGWKKEKEVCRRPWGLIYLSRRRLISE